jgi:glutathione S-transferase
MIKFFHYPICPLSRQIRVYLTELNLEVSLVKEAYWERREDFIRINPGSTLPVIIFGEEAIIGYYAITEFLSEKFDNFYLMPKTLKEKTKIRQEIYWFNEKFYREVSKLILEEKMIRLLRRIGGPRSEYIRAAKANLLPHFKYLTSRLNTHSYITSEQMTCADVVAASHISTIDYFGEVKWDNFPLIKQWYAIIKSRPSFRSILQDHIAGFVPYTDYANLDF